MFLIPLMNNHRSYSAEIVEDTSVTEEQLKQWVESLSKRKQLADEIHKKTLNELGETQT